MHEDSQDWDADNFVLTPLNLDDEDAFVAPTTSVADANQHGEKDTREPVLMINLSALRQPEEAMDYTMVREKVLGRLEASWSANLAELMATGVCWPEAANESTQRRQAYEEAHPGVVLTVVHYPRVVDGVPIEVLLDVVHRPTPWEVCDEIKRHIALAHRPLKWQADVSFELEEVAEREATWSDEVAQLTHERDKAIALKEQSIAAMQKSHDALETPLTPAEVTSMLAHIDELDRHIRDAERERTEAQLQPGGVEDEETESSLVEVVLDMIFEQCAAPAALAHALASCTRSSPCAPAALARPRHSLANTAKSSLWRDRTRGACTCTSCICDHAIHPLLARYPLPEGLTKPEHWMQLAHTKRELRRMWRSTFGRLPAASSLALKHAPKRPASKGTENIRPRMLVPGPPGAPRPRRTPSATPAPSTRQPETEVRGCDEIARTKQRVAAGEDNSMLARDASMALPDTKTPWYLQPQVTKSQSPSTGASAKDWFG